VQKIVIEIVIDFPERAEIDKNWLQNEHGYFMFNVTGSTMQSAEPKPIFFGKWVELMNIM